MHCKGGTSLACSVAVQLLSRQDHRLSCLKEEGLLLWNACVSMAGAWLLLQEGKAALAAMAARDEAKVAAAAAKNELEAYIIATADALGNDGLLQARTHNPHGLLCSPATCPFSCPAL